MSTALIVVDGLMRKLVGGAPIPEGLRLYRSLIATGRVVLLSDGTLQDWLELNGCIKHDFVALVKDEPLADVANGLRRQGYDIDLVVVPDPEEAKGLIEAGFNTLLYTHSAYAHPSWRPDTSKGVRPWGEIVDITAHQARMRAADERLKGAE